MMCERELGHDERCREHNCESECESTINANVRDQDDTIGDRIYVSIPIAVYGVTSAKLCATRLILYWNVSQRSLKWVELHLRRDFLESVYS